MNQKIKKITKATVSLLLLCLLLTPVFVFAQANAPQPGGGLDIGKLMAGLSGIIWQFFAGLSVVMFVVAGILFLTSNGDPGKVATARQAVIWGVVGIVVAVFAYSAISIITGAIK